MAEILISLTIVGVIAAIVIPSLIGKLNEKVWANQRKALYSRMSQAIAMMPKLAGYGEYEGTWGGTWSNPVVTVTKDTAAMTFLTDGLSKVMKINNICDNSNFDKCGISSVITDFRGDKKDFPKKLSELNPGFIGKVPDQFEATIANPQKYIDTNAVAFETANGEKVVLFYNPLCVSKDIKYSVGNVDTTGIRNAYAFLPYMCAFFVYDLNGKKGPNKVGNDIWYMSAIYADKQDLYTINPEKIIIKTVSANYADVLAYCEANNARLLKKEEGMFFTSAYGISANSSAWLNEKSELSGYKKAISAYAVNIEDYRETNPYIRYACIKR